MARARNTQRERIITGMIITKSGRVVYPLEETQYSVHGGMFEDRWNLNLWYIHTVFMHEILIRI